MFLSRFFLVSFSFFSRFFLVSFYCVSFSSPITSCLCTPLKSKFLLGLIWSDAFLVPAPLRIAGKKWLTSKITSCLYTPLKTKFLKCCSGPDAYFVPSAAGARGQNGSSNHLTSKVRNIALYMKTKEIGNEKEKRRRTNQCHYVKEH